MARERPNEALENETKVKPMEIKKERGVQITRCLCVECPELVKNNKIKTLLLSFADLNSEIIIKLKKILNPETPREYIEEEDDSIKVNTEPDTVKTEPKNEPEDNNDDHKIDELSLKYEAIRKRKHEGQYENINSRKRLKAEELVTLDEAVMDNIPTERGNQTPFENSKRDIAIDQVTDMDSISSLIRRGRANISQKSICELKKLLTEDFNAAIKSIEKITTKERNRIEQKKFYSVQKTLKKKNDYG